MGSVIGSLSRLDAPEALSLAVTLRELAQQIHNVIHFFRDLGPLADTRDAAVVKAVLAHGHGVKVDEDPQAVLSPPI